MTGPNPINLWAIIRALLPQSRDIDADTRRHRLDEQDLEDLETEQTGVRQHHAPPATERSGDEPTGVRGPDR